MPSRRDVLAAAGGAGLLGAAGSASADDRSTTTPTPAGSGASGSGSDREQTDWPMYRYGPGNSGAGPGARGPAREPPVAWVANAAATTAPAVTADLLVTGGEVVTALDPVDGDVHWRHEPSGTVAGQPVVAGDVVVVGGDGTLEAIDARDGDRLWADPVDGTVNAVAVVEDLVYADVADGTLAAINRLEGNVRWRYESEDALTGPPVVTGDVVYVGGSELRAVDATTGAVQWTASTTADVSAVDQLAVAAGRVFGVGTVEPDLAVVTAYDAETGERLWANRVQKDPDVGVGAPVAVGERLYVALEDLRVFDANAGEQVLASDVETVAGATPAVDGPRCYLREGRSRVTAVDVAGGKPRWTVDLGAELVAPPVVGRGVVYVVDERGAVHAAGNPEGTTRTLVEPLPEERTFGYEWVDSWTPMAGALGAPYVLGPLVLGGLVALSSRLRDDGASETE
jgi:outer membrane protein assembly factor BamB